MLAEEKAVLWDSEVEEQAKNIAGSRNSSKGTTSMWFSHLAWWLPSSSWWMILGLCFGLALLVSSLGFKRVVYFVSLGYAFSITGIALLSSVLWFRGLHLWTLLHGGLLVLYGVRLGSFLTARERRPSYKKELEEIQERSKDMTLFVRVMIWLSVSLLYVLMASAYLYHLHFALKNKGSFSWLAVAGIAVMGFGLFLEALADWQKSAFKADKPSSFCNVGLYRWVRTPNYLGEIIFWLGNLLAGVSFLLTFWQWVTVLVGTLCIFLIMMGSAKRLEAKQQERYGQQKEFQEYIQTTPILFPWVPLYSLQHIKVYLE